MIIETVTLFFSSKKFKRFFLWSSVVVFVLALPHAIFLYRAATAFMSGSNVGRIPFAVFLCLIFGLAVYVHFSNQTWTLRRFFPLITLSIVIWISVTFLEENSNKYIHIPQYMILSLLLFFALSVDYRGGGILLLTFILSSLLGVVDEMQQGLYPDRYFGWKDMVINSSGALLGVVLIDTLTAQSVRNWSWLRMIARQKVLCIILFSGLAGTIFTGLMLWEHKDDKTVVHNYENQILAWNIVYCTTAAMAVFRLLNKCVFTPQPVKTQTFMNTYLLWFITLFCLTFIIHAVSTLTLLTNLDFR